MEARAGPTPDVRSPRGVAGFPATHQTLTPCRLGPKFVPEGLSVLSEIVSWGDGQGLLIPSRVLAEAHVAVGEDVLVTVRERRIILEAAPAGDQSPSDNVPQAVPDRIEEDLRMLGEETRGWFAAYDSKGERVALKPTLAEMYLLLESREWPGWSLHEVGNDCQYLRGPSPRLSEQDCQQHATEQP